jgi:hypothetical protein
MTTERERAEQDADMTSEPEPKPATDDLPIDVRDGDVGQYEEKE